MRLKFFCKKLISFFFLILAFLLWGKTSVAYANIPGGAHGRVWMRDFEGNRHYLGGVKINREDKWTWPYCGGGKCWGYNDTVETTSRSDGYYDMANSGNNPGPIAACAEPSGANRCPTGPLGNVSEQEGVCFALNWCGFNCGSNPHRWKAYFPSGYSLPGNYSTTIGHWETPGDCGKPSEPWGSYGPGEYYQSGFQNYDNITGCNFIWVPEAIEEPAPRCTGMSAPSCINIGETFTISVFEVQNATSVKFPTWDTQDGQEDIVWYDGSQSESTWSVNINQSAHPKGNINVHVYMSNATHSDVWCGGRDNIPLCPTPTPTSPPLPPTCACEAWREVGCGNFCGGKNCSSAKMCQVQYCYWSDSGALCDTNYQCVEDDDCLRAWFQTEGGDVHAQGSISDQVPDGEYFCKDADYTNGYPGVVSYGGTSADLGTVSSKGWLANSTATLLYSFNYFYDLLGSPEENFDGSIPSSDPSGEEVEIYYSAGTTPIDGGWNIAPGRKVIILVGERGEQRNANIQDNITVQEGGFLALVASGHINIENSVAKIHGTYIADGHISTGEEDVEFTGEGMFISSQGPALGRDLGEDNEGTPAEIFVFRPDLWINAPKELQRSAFTWQELAP